MARTSTHTFNQHAHRCTPSRLCRDSISHAVRCRKLSLLNDMSRSATQQPASLSWSPATTASTWSTYVKERTYTNLYNLNLQGSHDDVGAKRGRNLRKCWHDDEHGSARGCGSHLRRRVAVQRQKWTPHQACEACKGRARGFRQRRYSRTDSCARRQVCAVRRARRKFVAGRSGRVRRTRND